MCAPVLGLSCVGRGRAARLAVGVSMTKAEIVAAVYSKVGGFSKKEAADIVEIVFETVKETLGRGEKIKISGFGNFVLRDKRQRRGRNPQTGQALTITERRVLTFKASQILKAILNPGDDLLEVEPREVAVETQGLRQPVPVASRVVPRPLGQERR